MFGISGSEFFVIVLVAVIVVGPQRLPEYTRKLTQMVRQLRMFLDNARSQIAEEVGPEMADLDLSSLDPRQYDPRKIVRDALGEDIDAIRDDLTHPFRSVGSAAKEVSDDAARAVNDVVKQDRANSLSRQIEAKRAEHLAEKDVVKDAADDTEGTAQAQMSEDEVSPQPRDASESAPADDAAADAENTGNTGNSAERPETSAPPQGVLRETDGAEPEAEPEPSESTGQAESVTARAERAGQPQSGDVQVEPQPGSAEVLEEIPASLSEPHADAFDENPGEASEPSDDQAKRLRPLSPRDIVRAANAAARTRAEAARFAIDF